MEVRHTRHEGTFGGQSSPRAYGTLKRFQDSGACEGGELRDEQEPCFGFGAVGSYRRTLKGHTYRVVF